MLATITAALMMLYAAATAQAEATVHRIHSAAIALHSLGLQMGSRIARTVVPDFMYLECKALYLELRPSAAVTKRVPPGAAVKRERAVAPVTKADLRAAVKTILRGEDVNAAKPGPRLTPAKRRQIEAAEAWRKSHAGCTLHNACIRSFVPARGGYRSAAALYSHMHESQKLGIPSVNS